MQTHFARQPILRKDKSLYGYELLFRPYSGAVSADVPHSQREEATITVLNSFMSVGIEKVTGGGKAFVNFSPMLLKDDIAYMFPKDKLVIEVLEDTIPTPSVLGAIIHLKREGFVIALDDFVLTDANRVFLPLADIVKVEVLDMDKGEENLRRLRGCLDLEKTMLLAEKVETQECFERCAALGCSLFQGYYFAKPALVSDHTVSLQRMNYVRLVGETCKEDVDFNTVARIIKQDVGMSYKILKLINSPYFGILSTIKDVRQAVVLLGERDLRKWITFISFSSINEDQPSELAVMSLVRANYCEKLAAALGKRGESEGYFLAGLFSLLDAMMGSDMKEAIADVSMPDITRQALMGEKGSVLSVLDSIRAIENGRWDEVSQLAEQMRIPEGKLADVYYETLQWSSDFVGL